jgi:hypothetical protein
MRQRDAQRLALRFVRDRYPAIAHWGFDIALEHDGERRKSWSFGLRPDEEDVDYEPHRNMVGYVHAAGYVEGLY